MNLLGNRKEMKNRRGFSFGRYIEHTKFLLRLFRMWELEDDLPKWKRVLVTVNATVLLGCNLFLGLSELTQIQSAINLRLVASGIGAFWLHLLGFSKWLYFFWKVHGVIDLVKKLENCYDLSLEIGEREIGDASRVEVEMKRALKNSVQFTYVWSTFVMYGVIHWCMNPIFLQLGTKGISYNESERLLPYEAWIPWDTKHSLGYWIAFLFEFTGSFASCIGHISYDSFYVTMVMMICAQFRYLNHVLEDNSDIDSNETEKKPTGRFLSEKLKYCKIHHMAILEFLATLEKVTSPVMFVQCVGTIGILCLVSFEAMTMNLQGDLKNTIRVWSMMEYIVGGFTQLFAFCYYASQVTALGLRISDSAYSCGWESLVSEKGSFGVEDNRGMKRDIKAVEYLTHEIITRAQKPVRLTASPFHALSLETYCAVVRVAFSYSAVLVELGEE